MLVLYLSDMTSPARHIAVTIDCPARDVYEFVVNPENLPQWASGLGTAPRKIGGKWIITMPEGDVAIAFAPANNFGIADHDVTLPSGVTVSNPMRIIPNGSGCDVVFTLHRHEGMNDEAFEKDAATIEKDLGALKTAMEH